MKKMIATGIICLLIGVAFCGAAYAMNDGNSSSDLSDTKHSFSADGISKIHIKDHVANVKIFKASGNDNTGEIIIKAENIVASELIISDNGGTLSLSYNPRTAKFGIISLPRLNFNKPNKMSVINIYIPEGKVFDYINLDGGVGTVYAEYLNAGSIIVDGGVGTYDIKDMTAKNLKVNGGVGTVKIAGAVVNGETKIDGGVGSIDIISAQLNGDAKIDGGVGTIDFSGEINGNLKLSTGVGSANLNLKGDAGDYDIKADRGVGSIRLNGSKMPDSVKHGGKYKITIDAGVGSININIK